MHFATHRGHGDQSIAASPAPRAAGVQRPVSKSARRARPCDYHAPAGLFVRTASGLRYRAFASVALALRHANEELSTTQFRSCAMDAGDARYTGEELEALYRAPGYPLARKSAAAE